MQPGARILDLGCGSGRDSKYYLYLDESAIADLFNSASIEIEYIWVTEDKLFREEKWLNIIGKKRGYQIK